ncbi:MAG: porin [Muribaculaceae bacterium]
MKKQISALLFCGAMLLPGLSIAQETTKVDSEEQKTESIVNKVLARLPKVSGYVQAGYNWQDANMGSEASTFQIKRMRLFLSGKISSVFDYKAQFECFSSSKDSKNKSLITVMDIFVDAHVNQALNFRMGQFYLPIGFENYDISPATLETIDFSNICYRIVCRNPITNKSYIDYGRDLGVMAYGDLFRNDKKGFNYLSYNLSFTNGSLPNLGDANKSKDFVGRLTFRPIKDLRIMGSYNYGKYNGVDVEAAEKPTVDNIEMNRFAIGAWYNSPKGLILRAEYGHLQSNRGGFKEDGFYALAAYKIGKFLPVVRFDMYRDQIDKANVQNTNKYLVGLTYQAHKQVKFQANYIHTTYPGTVIDAGNRKGSGNQIQIMCLASF